MTRTLPSKAAARLRHVRPGDADVCASIEHVCYHGHGAPYERIARRTREYPEGFLVAVADARVVGFINSGCVRRNDIGDDRLKDLKGHDPQGRYSVIFSLAVDPAYQHRGIAGLLLRRFLRESRRAGKAAVLLICRRKLIPFYARAGFAYRRPSNARYGGFKWHEMAFTFTDPATNAR
jgi:ribosomal protein S18 acetylase RimI-like enzyme